MSDNNNKQSQSPDPQGRFAGMPYDFRAPTVKRAQARLWNKRDSRFFTPKAFGWGYDINFYWMFHPRKYFANRGRQSGT